MRAEDFKPEQLCIHPITEKDLKELKVESPSKERNIGVACSAFMRDRCTLIFVKSLMHFQPGVKLYIGDQGISNPMKERFYKMLTDAGHHVEYVGFDLGLGATRNVLIKKITESYVYIADDDCLLYPETDLEKAKKILQADPTLGICGLTEIVNGKPVNYSLNLEIKDRALYYYAEYLKHPNDELFYCDCVVNNFLAKREMFNDVGWDDFLKMAEHTSFFLHVKYHSKWKVASSRIPCYNQNPSMEGSIYGHFRGRNNEFFVYYGKTWNIDRIVNHQKDVPVFIIPKE
jgi:glycosyltransferase involved in cell wall biosynthesis